MTWLLVAGMAETGEEYLCQLLDHSARGHDPIPSPIVRVLGVLRWPRQRAIADAAIAHEIAPLGRGLICRLPALRALNREEAELAICRGGVRDGDALDAALREAGSDAERAILLRHRQGLFSRAQRVTSYREWEWQMMKHHGEHDAFEAHTVRAEEIRQGREPNESAGRVRGGSRNGQRKNGGEK